MSSDAETSLEIPGSSKIQGFFDSAADEKAQQNKQHLFTNLIVYREESRHSAAMNMSIDEALLRSQTIPTIRFYRWRSPSLSFGYFGRFADVAVYAAERDIVRRWTGGGIVLHGADLTYAIVIPASDPVFDESSIAIYEKIHGALAYALNGIGERAVVAGSLDSGAIAFSKQASGSNCFTNPVRADVMMDGRKIAGAAQRRTRRGLLQQGSIQGFAMSSELAEEFSQRLSLNRRESEINQEIFQWASELARQKYGTDSWLRKR
jgi:lipoyl(octanoyl) transferase